MLSEKLDSLIMEAMKAHNEVRTRTLRGIKAAFIEARTAKGAGELDEAKEVQVMQKMVKQREDARQQYIDANRIELAKNEFEEMQIIQEFLPKPVTKVDIEAWFNTKTDIPEVCMKNMGQFVSLIKADLPGADGKLISEVVKERSQIIG